MSSLYPWGNTFNLTSLQLNCDITALNSDGYVYLLSHIVMSQLSLLSINEVYDSTSGPLSVFCPLQGHVLSKPNQKSKIGLRSPEELKNIFRTSHQPIFYVNWSAHKVAHEISQKCILEKKKTNKRRNGAENITLLHWLRRREG